MDRPWASRARLTMTIYGWLIPALWLTLVAYWISLAAAVRRSTGRRWLWWREIAVRLAFFGIAVFALQVAVESHALPNVGVHALNTNTLMGRIGSVVTGLGIGLAILGRAYLGWNRSTPVSDKENLELVTNGPYAFVRHPIYGGMLLAVLGSALGQSVLWLLPLIVYGPFFIRSARREEKHLSEQFPERYRAYEKRTKMLLPFVL
jgi:protein-S-isoprenylcysteine O-methyltransferase Ste14